MNDDNQYYMLENFTDKEINFKYLQLINFVLEKKQEFYNKNKNRFSSFYMRYYIHIVNNNYYQQAQNSIENFNQTNIWDNIKQKFSDIEFKTQEKWFDNIMFSGKIFTNIANSIIFLNKFYIQNGGFKKYGFNEKFNEFINSCDKSQFDKFYSLITQFCTPKNIILGEIPTQNNAITRDKTQPINIINKYLEELEEQIRDPIYILYNKLQILKYLFNDYNKSIKQTYHFKETMIKGNNWMEQKIINHPEYEKIQKEYYEKFLGNILLPYKKAEDVVFVSIDEIIYNME